MAKSAFLTNSELRKITGETTPKRQMEVLTSFGLHPIINQVTGVPIIYREAVIQSMGRDDSDVTANRTQINLDAI